MSEPEKFCPCCGYLKGICDCYLEQSAQHRRIAELERESACPCCRKGVSVITGEICQECHGKGLAIIAYEHVRFLWKQQRERIAELEAEILAFKNVIDLHSIRHAVKQKELEKERDEAKAALAEERARLDCGRITLPLADNLNHTWTGVNLRAAIDSARRKS